MIHGFSFAKKERMRKMKRFAQVFSMLLVLAMLLGAFSLVVCAEEAEVMDLDAAMEYLDGYSDNVGSDGFDTMISEAISVARESVSSYATIWALLPPVIAIALALITKEVYSSLFIGILAGALLNSNFNIWGMVTFTTDTLIGAVSDSWNVGILIFLVLLGMMVTLVNKAGGSAAYGRWASEHIKSKAGAQIATLGLGAVIFIDDYFNCLTVGSVMRPVTDKFKISREKLAYIIDSTAAPVCIIAPISSWAAAVSSVAPEGQGLSLFIRAIPYNLYALLTLGTVLYLSFTGMDYGKMLAVESKAAQQEAKKSETVSASKGKVMDLIIPIVILIVSCVVTMIYTGGFFDSESDNYLSVFGAFGDSDASVGLVLGAFIAIAGTMVLYLPRKILTFKDFADAIPEGFKSMVGSILILCFAWTLSGVTNALGAKIFVAEFVRNAAGGLANFLPAIVFVIGVGLAFSTGTSWGTFGVLLPIVCAVFPTGEQMVIAVSACLAGAVCGDHCSPISDTTIMASAGAECEHIEHVSTQLPYALTVAAVSFVGYVVAGFVPNVWVVLPVSFILMFVVLTVLQNMQVKNA